MNITSYLEQSKITTKETKTKRETKIQGELSQLQDASNEQLMQLFIEKHEGRMPKDLYEGGNERVGVENVCHACLPTCTVHI